MSQMIEIGGRRFTEVSDSAGMTVAHENFFMGHYLALQLQKHFEIREGETPEDMILRVTGHLYASGKASLLMASLLVPAGKDPLQWTPELALEIAGWLDGLTDERTKAWKRRFVGRVLIPFWMVGPPGSAGSATSSPGAGTSATPEPIGSGTGAS